MIISKDVQDVLEGVHYFLSVTLRCERLKLDAEGERRGLLSRLESLSLTHPALSLLRHPSAASLPYLPMDTPPMFGKQQVHPNESSSGGSNSYSNSSSSGDGLVLARGVGGLAGGSATLPPSLHFNHHKEEEEEEEIYEEFDEAEEINIPIAKVEQELVEARRDDVEDKEDGEGVYMEVVEAVPFSTIIASCEKHGVVSKRTKGLLRSLKSYHIVAANARLYLYLRDTDERQRKTIDLTGYTARSATGEDIKGQRKRDSAFEVVGPGKKTHTFIARTARDKLEWLEALARTIKVGRNQTGPTSKLLSTGAKAGVPELVISQHVGSQGKSHTLPSSSQGLGANPSEEYIYYHDVAEDERDEVYEEVTSEGPCDFLPAPPPSLLSPSPPPPPSRNPSPPLPSFLSPSPLPPHLPRAPSPQPPSSIPRVSSCHKLPSFPPPPPPEELPDYDPVCPENSLPLSPLKLLPPGRPPLPAVLQDRLNTQATRPLPDAPYDQGEDSDDGIYCEIEEDMLEMAKEKYLIALEGRKGKENGERIQVNGEVKQHSGDAPPLPNRASSNSLVGFLSDEIFQGISKISTSSPNRYPSVQRPGNTNTPPKLPLKGLPPVASDDSEYKVPISVNIDTEYQVPPSNPVPTSADGSGASNPVHSISGPLKPVSQLYQVPPSQTIMSIKPTNNDKRKPGINNQAKPLSSFLSGKEDPYSKSSFNSLAQRFENSGESRTSGEVKPGQSSSVKDMIARLNKNKEDQLAKAKDDATPSLAVEPGKINTGGELKQIGELTENVAQKPTEVKKPSLPPRPMNLLNGSPVKQQSVSPATEKLRDSGTSSEPGACSDDDYYETPDDTGADVSTRTVGQGTSGRGNITTAPPAVNTETAGELYVAKFAFVATIDQALSFSRGDQITVHDNTGTSGWWRASFKGRQGLVPREYLKKKEEGKT